MEILSTNSNSTIKNIEIVRPNVKSKFEP